MTVEHSGRVMIVDDEPGMLRAAERVLAANHEVKTVGDPRDALRVLDTFDADLVICDIRMPHLDGFALTELMRAHRPDLDVIFMTGSSAEPDAALVRAIRSEAFYFIQKPFDRQVLLTLVERCLELRRLRRTQRAHTARLERELAEARVAQRALLPDENGSLGAFRIAARLDASQELGGDFFDYAPTPDGGIGLIIADACGHGASAALMTSVIKSSFRAAAAEQFSPVAVCERLGHAIRLFGTGRFVTAICARILPAEGVIEYINAGHPAGVLTGRGRAGLLETTASLISADLEPEPWDIHRTGWQPGMTLFACTDGLGDALRCSSRTLSDRLRQWSEGETHPGAMVEAARRAALAALGGRPAPDDITLLAVSQIDG